MHLEWNTHLNKIQQCCRTSNLFYIDNRHYLILYICNVFTKISILFLRYGFNSDGHEEVHRRLKDRLEVKTGIFMPSQSMCKSNQYLIK